MMLLKGMGMELPFTTDANFGGFFNEVTARICTWIG